MQMRNICTWTLSLWKTSQCYWHDNVEFLTINFFFELSVFYKITDNLWGNFFVIFYCKHVTNCQCWLELLFLMECTVFDGVNSFLPNCSLSQGTLNFFYLAVLLLLDCKLCSWSILNWCIEDNKKCFFFVCEESPFNERPLDLFTSIIYLGELICVWKWVWKFYSGIPSSSQVITILCVIWKGFFWVK